MRKRQREPSLLKKLIDIHHEEAMAKKAMRLLSKQEWSVDFLCMLCAKAAKLTGSPVEIVVESPSKQVLSIKSQDIAAFAAAEDNILDKLDDTAAVEAFIRKHNTR
jgi:hypothetical protein